MKWPENCAPYAIVVDEEIENTWTSNPSIYHCLTLLRYNEISISINIRLSICSSKGTQPEAGTQQSLQFQNGNMSDFHCHVFSSEDESSWLLFGTQILIHQATLEDVCVPRPRHRSAT